MKFISAKDIEATTNEVVDHYFDTGAKLTVRVLDDTEVLIEGKVESLEFLANFILAYINGDEHGRNISPNGAGNAFFTPKSTHGLYIIPYRAGMVIRTNSNIQPDFYVKAVETINILCLYSVFSVFLLYLV